MVCWQYLTSPLCFPPPIKPSRLEVERLLPTRMPTLSCGAKPGQPSKPVKATIIFFLLTLFSNRQSVECDGKVSLWSRVGLGEWSSKLWKCGKMRPQIIVLRRRVQTLYTQTPLPKSSPQCKRHFPIHRQFTPQYPPSYSKTGTIINNSFYLSKCTFLKL